MEIDFGQEAYTSDFDGFMRHYLTVKTSRIPRISEVYESFKEYATSMQFKNINMSMIVEDIRKFSKYFCNMTLKQEPDKDLQLAFNDLKELRVDVAYPMLLEVYNDYVSGVLAKNDFVEIIRLIEAYVFRRNICSIPTNSLNKTFSTFMKLVDRMRYVESVKAHFILLPSYASKFNRVIAFTNLEITDFYAVKLVLVSTSINILNKTMPITIITGWEVAIRDCEFKNFTRLIRGQPVSTGYFIKCHFKVLGFHQLFAEVFQTAIAFSDFFSGFSS